MDKQKELDDYSHGIQTWYYNNSEMDIGELVKRVVEDTRRAIRRKIKKDRRFNEKNVLDNNRGEWITARAAINEDIENAVPQVEGKR